MADTPEVRPVGDLPDEIGKTAARELSINGITSLEQLAAHSKKELLAMHGVGCPRLGESTFSGQTGGHLETAVVPDLLGLLDERPQVRVLVAGAALGRQPGVRSDSWLRADSHPTEEAVETGNLVAPEAFDRRS